MYERIVSRDQLSIGSLVRNIHNNKEILEIEEYDAENNFYNLSIAGRIVPQTGGKGDSLNFGSTFENLATNYQVEIVVGGFKNEGEA
ncbi:hypothetical protein [Sphingobacterium sp. UDSM-2020]|uniref:hypothetical protein n=1 Tax=Sphingobacterium sp. UDSM-2020 TaxID=2795738 RepID=UPI001934DD78|nr:hypothetical protein [Sphingobacterium sp. UDSM-2020]QQD15058.1 hypothetical protein JAZ75_05900 [Sphingobacterium sp. UDSM-2020]